MEVKKIKKLILTLSVFLSLAGYAYAIPSFKVIETTYNIDGTLCGLYGDCPGYQYNQTSNVPIANIVDYDDPSMLYQKAQSIAAEGYLYGEIIDYNGQTGHQSRIKAWSETVFSPFINGSGPTFSFYFAWDYPYGQFNATISDINLGFDIFNLWDENYIWHYDGEGDTIGVTFTCDYNDWNPDHNYILMTSIWGSTNAVGHHQYEMKTDFFAHTAVPEPTTMLLIGTGLLCFAGVKRKKVAR